MKIRRTEELIDFLDEQLAWRKKELSLILSVINSNKTSAPLREALIRSGIPILYAHWEGFVKVSATHYVEYVVRQGLTFAEVASNFVALAMKKQLMDASESNKISTMNNVADFFINSLAEKYKAPWMVLINTKSNLSSEVLLEILSSIGVDYTFFETKRHLLDKKLLDSRNNIAHGKQLSMETKDYEELHSEVIIMLDHINNEIQNAAVTKGYRRKVVP